MLGILVHGDFRTVEDGWLVHIIPDEKIMRGALVLVEGKLVRPPRSDVRVKEIQPGGAACSRPKFKRCGYS